MARSTKKVNSGKSFAYEEILKHLDDIENWAREGLSEGDIAKRFGISRTTFWKYKNEDMNILNAIKKGRMDLVSELKNSLAQKARGFHYIETKRTYRCVNEQEIEIIEEYERYSPPDTGAIHLLLKNLCDDWRNDDKPTMDLKREKLELEKSKAENESW